MRNKGLRKLAGRATTLTALTAAGTVAFSGLAVADILQDTIADTGTGVSLVAGSATAGSAAIRVVGNSAAGDPDPGCNIDAGENPLELDIVTPAGVTANPDPLTITSCGTDFTVSFSASASAVSGRATVTVLSGPAGGGTYVNQVDIPITVIRPNTKPSVTVTGVTEGGAYEIGAKLEVGCNVTDAEDGNSTKAAVLSGVLTNGLGSQTATCDHTDLGGLAADTKSVTFSIVDTGDPTISHTLSSESTKTADGWYNRDVVVEFTCADAGSGIQSCTGDATLTEGAAQSVTGTAKDWAGNTATDTTSSIDVDKTDPTVTLTGNGPTEGARYYTNTVPAAPSCGASDALSGIASCNVTGYGTAEGTHTLVATATDKAGNVATTSRTYTVRNLSRKGFYAPVDGNGVYNTIKGGNTVPLKFEVFDGAQELKDKAMVSGFTAAKVNCTTGGEDAIEVFATTGQTELRFDTTGDHFIQNWKTPTGSGCYRATMTTVDGQSISALFKTLK